MKSTKYHLPPNVIAGTNFNVARFQELYSWIEACRADAISFDLSDYGLLCDEHSRPCFDLQINGDQLQLDQCFGITAQGILIDIIPEEMIPLKMTIDEQQIRKYNQLDVIIVADLKGERTAIGQADSSEIPWRLPFSTLSVRLELQNPDSIDARGDFLKVGELELNNGVAKLSDYIPPCVHMGAHPALWNRIKIFQQQLKEFYQALIIIINKIDVVKENAVVVSYSKLCKEIGSYMSIYMPMLRNLNPYSRPQDFFNWIQRFTERISFEWQVHPRHTELQELIQYNVRNSTNHFDLGVLENVAQHVFNPLEIDKTLELINQFIDNFVMPFISISSQSRIMRKQEQTVWEEKKSIDRNVW